MGHKHFDHIPNQGDSTAGDREAASRRAYEKLRADTENRNGDSRTDRSATPEAASSDSGIQGQVSSYESIVAQYGTAEQRAADLVRRLAEMLQSNPAAAEDVNNIFRQYV